MNKDWIKYLAIGGGVYLAYWYITNYGPSGAVTVNGQKMYPSYWDVWFGGVSATPSVASAPGAVPPGFPNQPPAPASQPGSQPVLTQPSQPPATAPINTTTRNQILTASAGNPAIQGGYAVPDVWSYYWQQVTGRNISPSLLAQAFPPVGNTGAGAPLNLDQFLSGLQRVGLSGVGAIVTTPAIPSLPGMSFGGGFRKPGIRGISGRGMGGQTVQ